MNMKYAQTKNCFLQIYNDQTGKTEWVEGVLVGERKRFDTGIGYDVKTENALYEGCHKDCVRVVISL